ncbi:MAG: peptidyl-prolyl cis-trans isomerase [Candidatus Omnitrophota bacterium]
MKRSFIIFSSVSVSLLFILGCDKLSFPFKKPIPQATPTPKIEGTVLAKINAAVITLEDFNSRVDNYNQMAEEKDKINTLDEKKNLLQLLIQQELLYQNAHSLGVDKDPQVEKAVNEFRKGIIVQKLISDKLTNVGVEASEIENFYNMAKNNFRTPEEIKVSEIVVSSEETAKQILIEVLKGTDFASLAVSNSKASSARRGGSLGWLKLGDRKVERFDEVAFSLKKGEISNVFGTPEGYFILKVEDRKGGQVKPISEVWDQVKEELLNFKQNQIISDLERDLRAKSTIEIREELLR